MSIAEFAAAQGIELLPWQIAAAESIERGEPPVLVGCKKSGRETFKRIVREWKASLATAPDVRAATQVEADKLYPLLTELEIPAISKNRRLRQKAFIKGAVWGAALVTPTREQIARAIALTDDYDGCFERIDDWEALEEWEREAQPQEAPLAEYEDAGFWLQRADAVLALMAGLAEGENDE